MSLLASLRREGLLLIAAIAAPIVIRRLMR